MDKFLEYYKDPERLQELSQYVHENFKLIQTKMMSEMRRKLDIDPSMDNSTGYLSLICTLYGRMVNEVVYALCALSQSCKVPGDQIIPQHSFKMLLDLYEGKNVLEGRLRTDVKEDIIGFRKYYLENIDELRSYAEALPKG